MKFVVKINNFFQIRLVSKLNFQLTDDNRTTIKVENNCLCEHSKESTGEVYIHAVNVLRRFPSTSVNQLTVWVRWAFNNKMMSVFIVQQSYFHQHLSGLEIIQHRTIHLTGLLIQHRTMNLAGPANISYSVTGE